jgi:transcriptional regulator with XRE-family HTH domain
MVKNIMIQKLIEIAIKNGYSQTEMAYKLGISIPTWNRWISGKCFTRSYNTLKQISSFIENNSESKAS